MRTICCFTFVIGGLLAQDARDVREPFFPPVCTQLAAQFTTPPASEDVLDTARIQNALNGCAPGQAVELQPAGDNNAFLTGPIQLPKGVTLLIDPGVTLLASRNPRDYDSNASHSCGTLTTSGGGCVPLITANRADGAGIMGYGAIDGRGELPMLINGAPVSMSWWDLARSAVSPLTQNNPRLLQVSNTNNFTLYKITLLNSPNFHVSLGNDTNFTAWGVKVITPYTARNTDGIDPGYSHNVTIANSYLSDGDDNVAIGGNNNPGASNISVVNTHFGDGHGASIGSYTQAGVSGVLFDHITIAGTPANSNSTGIRIKSDVSRGGLVQNVTYNNFCMRNVHTAIALDPFYTANATGNHVPEYLNIALGNIHATTEGTVSIRGHDASVPSVVSLNNVQIDGIKASDFTSSDTSYTVGPDPVNFAGLIKGNGVTLTNNVSTTNAPYSCPAEVFSPIAGELIADGLPQSVKVQVFATKAGMPAPTGTVSVLAGTTVVGTATLAGDPLLSVSLGDISPGTHVLSATYSGDSNYAPITFGNYPIVVGDTLPGTPAIAAGGIVNAASFAAGNIAPGSLFSIYGKDFGADSSSVQILSGGNQYDAEVVFASDGQLNVLLPPDVPAGPAQLTVTHDGLPSLPADFTVAAANPGIFFQPANGIGVAVAQNFNAPDQYPLNSPASPAMPGQIVVFWGTGLGSPPAPVAVTVGGLPAAVDYAGPQSQFAGVDNVYFTVPSGVIYGCQVPVAISAGGVLANTTVMAITADGSSCE